MIKFYSHATPNLIIHVAIGANRALDSIMAKSKVTGAAPFKSSKYVITLLKYADAVLGCLHLVFI